MSVDDETLYQLEKHEGDIDCDGAAAEIRALRAAVDDLNVQCKFWRQAAEHAVNGWNKLEDEHEALLEKLSALASDNRDEWAPPVLHGENQDVVVDVGFGKMRLVEDETPLEEK